MRAKQTNKKYRFPQSNWFLAFIRTPSLDLLVEGTAADCRRRKIKPYFISRNEKDVFIVIRPPS